MPTNSLPRTKGPPESPVDCFIKEMSNLIEVCIFCYKKNQLINSPWQIPSPLGPNVHKWLTCTVLWNERVHSSFGIDVTFNTCKLSGTRPPAYKWWIQLFLVFVYLIKENDFIESFGFNHLSLLIYWKYSHLSVPIRWLVDFLLLQLLSLITWSVALFC